MKKNKFKSYYFILFSIILFIVFFSGYIFRYAINDLAQIYNVFMDSEGLEDAIVEDFFNLTTDGYEKNFDLKFIYRGPYVVKLKMPILNPEDRDIRTLCEDGLLIIEYYSKNQLLERKEIKAIDSYVVEWENGVAKYIVGKIDMFTFYNDFCHRSIDRIRVVTQKSFNCIKDNISKDRTIKIIISYYRIL